MSSSGKVSWKANWSAMVVEYPELGSVFSGMIPSSDGDSPFMGRRFRILVCKRTASTGNVLSRVHVVYDLLLEDRIGNVWLAASVGDSYPDEDYVSVIGFMSSVSGHCSSPSGSVRELGRGVGGLLQALCKAVMVITFCYPEVTSEKRMPFELVLPENSTVLHDVGFLDSRNDAVRYWSALREFAVRIYSNDLDPVSFLKSIPEKRGIGVLLNDRGVLFLRDYVGRKCVAIYNGVVYSYPLSSYLRLYRPFLGSYFGFPCGVYDSSYDWESSGSV